MINFGGTWRVTTPEALAWGQQKIKKVISMYFVDNLILFLSFFGVLLWRRIARHAPSAAISSAAMCVGCQLSVDGCLQSDGLSRLQGPNPIQLAVARSFGDISLKTPRYGSVDAIF